MSLLRRPSEQTRMARRRGAQRGASGVLVLAAMAILGAIGAWASGLVGGAIDTTAQAIAVSQARQAALGGLDWSRWRLTQTGAAPCAAQQNVVVPGQASALTVTTRCATLGGPFSDGGVPVRRWQVIVSACNQPQGGACPSAQPAAGYIEFQAQGQAER